MKDNIELAKDYTDWNVKEGCFARDMTLRDHFAGLAMQGLIAADVDYSNELLVNYAYILADAMLEERAK
tara:strand:- start:914 stop:1120 length:207 start_codon:yes stop_codon:yes gene_type:complete